MKKIKIALILIILTNIFLCSFKYEIYAVKQTVSTDINSINTTKYPGVKEKIQSLKKEHPKWNFKILYTGIKWDEAISYEYTGHGSSPKNLVPSSSSYGGAWVCDYCGNKVYDSGSWKCASVSAIKYMMDARNFLNSSDVFQFLELSYNSKTGYSKDVLKKMLKDSFLDNDKYIKAIMDSSKKYNVNPYYIVARIIQEQGKSGSVLTKGQGYNGQYVGYYNVFNIGATGSNKDKVILNGLAKAKANNWTTMELSIDGGIKVISSSYIAVGQNTMYLQKFDVDNSDGKMYWHQYMQNILAAKSEGATLLKTIKNINAVDYEYTFIIPVFESMPKNACAKPATTNTNTNTNNNNSQGELVRVNADPSIRIRKTPNGDATGKSLVYGEIATRLEKATSKVGGTYWDKILKNDGTVGYVARCTFDSESKYKDYLVPVNGNKNNTNTNNNNNNTNTNTSNNSNSNNTTNGTNNTNNTSSKKGDSNGDNKIDAMDMYNLIQHLLKKKVLTGQNLKNVDINDDSKIDAMDMYLLIKKIINK